MDKNKWIMEKVKNFQLSFAYKFNHKQGCDFYADYAEEVCSCNAMKEIISFLRQSLEEAIDFGRDQGVNGWKNDDKE